MLVMSQRKDKQGELLGVLGSAWLDRNQIAEALGKKKLNPLEMKYLEELVETGALRREIQIVGISEKFVYRKA
jgi:prolyl-tRNA editing enzyme YbaK/EbsC (Cys-tRNA(Pro) deacylase)